MLIFCLLPLFLFPLAKHAVEEVGGFWKVWIKVYFNHSLFSGCLPEKKIPFTSRTNGSHLQTSKISGKRGGGCGHRNETIVSLIVSRVKGGNQGITNQSASSKKSQTVGLLIKERDESYSWPLSRMNPFRWVCFPSVTDSSSLFTIIIHCSVINNLCCSGECPY